MQEEKEFKFALNIYPKAKNITMKLILSKWFPRDLFLNFALPGRHSNKLTQYIVGFLNNSRIKDDFCSKATHWV